MDMKLDLAQSWLYDFSQHFHGRIHGKTAEDNVEACVNLLKSEDAHKLFNQEFLQYLKKQVLSRRLTLVKDAEDKIEIMKRGF